MANKTMKTLTIGENIYEIVDASARNNIESLGQRVGTAETDISNLKQKANTAESDIGTLKQKATNVETDIEALKQKEIDLDTTLTQSGMAADAKSVGDTIDALTADDVGALSIDETDAEQGEALPTNADRLGNVPAEDYALKTEVNVKAEMYAQKAILPVASWEQNGDVYSQNVVIDYITIDKNKTSVIVSPPTDRTMEEAYLGSEVRCSEQGNGTLNFTCTSLPEIDLEANVLVVVQGVTAV